MKIRSVEAGYFASFSAARRGRLTSSPPQLGHMPLRTVVAQSTQNVHSNVQLSASGDSGGRSRSQHSQLGRSWSMSIPFHHILKLSNLYWSRPLTPTRNDTHRRHRRAAIFILPSSYCRPANYTSSDRIQFAGKCPKKCGSLQGLQDRCKPPIEHKRPRNDDQHEAGKDLLH